MQPMIEFFVPGTPVAQSRPKFARRGNFVTAYDPARSKDYKTWVKQCATQYMDTMNISMFERNIPLVLSVRIHLQKPQSAPKTREIFATKKPDCDNVLKGLQDAMESICYEKDQQIVSVRVFKTYVNTRPGCDIKIFEYK